MKKYSSLTQKTLPVLLGADLNAYSVAQAFHRATWLRSLTVGKTRLALSAGAPYIDFIAVPDICEGGVFPRLAEEIREASPGAERIVVPCSDWYAELLDRARADLPGYFFAFPSHEVYRVVSKKAELYALLSRHGIPYPPTAVIDGGFDFRALPDFGFPAVLKPSDSSEYWRHPFSGMRKVYFPRSVDEVRDICDTVFTSGYRGDMIFQKLIGGGRDMLSVLTTYSTREGRAVRAVLSDVLTEENGRTAKGNHAALITRPLNALATSVVNMLDAVGYTGIANFDIISDGEEQYVLELNPRQGRSCDSLRAAGVNLAALLLADMRGESIEPDFSCRRILWRSVSRSAAFLSTGRDELIGEAESLISRGEEHTPFSYPPELRNPLRRLYLRVHERRASRAVVRDFRTAEAGGEL